MYWHGFLFSLRENDIVIDQIVNLWNALSHASKDEKSQKEDLVNQFAAIVDEDPMDKVTYLIDNCFENWGREQIDMEYVFTIIDAYDQYKDVVASKVNFYTTTFTFDQMDMIDQSVFILGYIEFLKLRTPREVLLNEMVELSKRYGDDWSSKLINGILHQMIVELEAGPTEVSLV